MIQQQQYKNMKLNQSNSKRIISWHSSLQHLMGSPVAPHTGTRIPGSCCCSTPRPRLGADILWAPEPGWPPPPVPGWSPLQAGSPPLMGAWPPLWPPVRLELPLKFGVLTPFELPFWVSWTTGLDRPGLWRLIRTLSLLFTDKSLDNLSKNVFKWGQFF